MPAITNPITTNATWEVPVKRTGWHSCVLKLESGAAATVTVQQDGIAFTDWSAITANQSIPIFARAGTDIEVVTSGVTGAGVNIHIAAEGRQ